ncbi:MAG: hypothetical protein FWF29_08345, partial [Treponema sp.]|nr:hypothetical protein [Treponema sp.]
MKIKAGLFPVTAALLILLPSLNAKLYPDPLLISSPQNTSTAGRFNSDTDNFLSPRNYSGVNFDKWLGLISFSSGQKEYNYNEMAQLGFAAKFGGVYTAAYYGGNA